MPNDPPTGLRSRFAAKQARNASTTLRQPRQRRRRNDHPKNGEIIGLSGRRKEDSLPAMRNEFTAEIHREGKWFVAFCPEVPEANGQGKTRDDCLRSLAAAIELVFEDRRATFRQQRHPQTEEAIVAIG
jgi:predicted RNase H-like HicB family nuclease